MDRRWVRGPGGGPVSRSGRAAVHPPAARYRDQMKSPAAHLRSVRAWWGARRGQRTLRVGDSVTVPDGSTHVLPKDWDDMTIADLVSIGVGPGADAQPDFYEPFPPGLARSSRRRQRRWAKRSMRSRIAGD